MKKYAPDAVVLVPTGKSDGTAYREARDATIKMMNELPQAIMTFSIEPIEIGQIPIDSLLRYNDKVGFRETLCDYHGPHRNFARIRYIDFTDDKPETWNGFKLNGSWDDVPLDTLVFRLVPRIT